MQYSKEERAVWLEGWRRSGKSISSYVKENGLVRWTFHKWIKAEKAAKAGFVEIQTNAAAQFHVSMILIEKGDVKIHIPFNLSSGELRMIMEGLGVSL